MEKYYNHLTDRMEDLEPFMAKTLPRSKEEYLAREREREQEKPPKYDMTYHTGQTAKDAITKAAKDYLDAHPEEVIKLRDEGLVQEMVDFAAKQNAELDPNAFNGAPTEEEVYLSKREREGRPLIIYEEVGDWKDASLLQKSFDALSKEKQEELNKAIETLGNPLKDHPCNKESEWKQGEPLSKLVSEIDRDKEKSKGSDWDLDKAFEPSRYMMGNDPYGDADTKSHMYKKNDDGSVEYLRTPEDILGDENDEEQKYSIETISKWIIFGFIGAALGVILWYILQ